MAQDVRSGLRAVCERIECACARAGRDPAAVRLVAVTKTVPLERVRELLDAGHLRCGENRVQEALAKQDALGPGAEWHLVGHLQRNKAHLAAGRFALIHALDDARLAADLDRRAAALGLRQPVLIQVNVSREPTKHGVEEAALSALVDVVRALEHLELRGLMAIPAPAALPQAVAPAFRRLRDLRDAEAGRIGGALPELSMGMTDDFEVAIAEGATIVRVGRAIFGPR